MLVTLILTNKTYTTMKLFHLSKSLLVSLLILCTAFQPSNSVSWDELVEYVVGNDELFSSVPKTLNMEEIGDMRARDIKRRLSRTHGYSAEELVRMIDKKDLINALSFEEHKTRQQHQEKQKRFLAKRGIIAALIAVALVLFWPLLSHAYEVSAVNFVVYTDRKRLEAQRCWELKSTLGFVGIVLMLAVDLLQIWLSGSVILSWVMTSKYFFPVPSLPIHPAKLMGGEIANGPLSRYGLNVGPMAISWGLRFANSTIEAWTGRFLSKAQREMKRKARENETEKEREERKARKAARKAAKQAAKEQAATAAGNRSRPNPPDMPMPANGDNNFPYKKEQPVVETASVQEFLQDEFDNPQGSEPEPSALDELD